MIRLYGDTSSKKEVLKISHWMANEILGPDLSKKLSLSIIWKDLFGTPDLTAIRKDNRLFGYCMRLDTNKFRFVISSFLNNTTIKACKTIAHEMKHVQQYMLGDLYEYPVIPYVRWKGRRYADNRNAATTKKEYNKLPWEKDARHAEILFKKYLRHHPR